MRPRSACGCHEDYHELGVHCPGYPLPTWSSEASDGQLAVAGAA